jgi:hypothetical protein
VQLNVPTGPLSDTYARFTASFLAETLFELGQTSAAAESSAAIVEVNLEAEVEAAKDVGMVFRVRMAKPSGP